jgi:hypothetical protein
MTIDRIRADLAAATAANEHRRMAVLGHVLSLIDAHAAANHRGVPNEADVQAGLREALVAAERQEDRLEHSNRLGAAEITEKDILMLAGYVNVEI